MDSSDQNLNKISTQSAAILDINDIQNITDVNIKLLKPEWLLNEDVLFKIKQYVMDIIDADEMPEIMDSMATIHSLVSKAQGMLRQRPDIFAEYLRMLAVLKASLLMTFNNTAIRIFFQENLVICLEVLDFDLGRRIFSLLNLYRKDPKEFEEQRREIQNALENNHEVLGKNYILLSDDNSQNSYMSNWIMDYNQFAASSVPSSNVGIGGFVAGSGSRRGSFQRILYMEKSRNVRQLSKEEKVVLLRFLDFYDWIKNIKPGEKYSPYENEEISSYMIAQNGRLDEVQEPKAKEEEAKKVEQKFEAKPVLPIIPKPVEKPVVPVAPSKEIKEEEVSSKQTSSRIEYGAGSNPSLLRRGMDGQGDEKNSLVQPIEIEIEVPPGISFGPNVQGGLSPLPNPPHQGEGTKDVPSNLLNVKSQIEEKKKQIEGEIDKKIEELRKKV